MNTIDETKQQILTELLDYIDSEVAYFPLTKTSPVVKFSQALDSMADAVEKKYKTEMQQLGKSLYEASQVIGKRNKELMYIKKHYNIRSPKHPTTEEV